ncbi:MAG: hypothetical protein ACTSQP_22365, partial [Promethearchaeota archaeon]
CDIDGTLIYSPYQCPIFLNCFNINIQHQICQSEKFRKYLLKANLLDYIYRILPVFKLANKVIFLTGRNKYNRIITENFLYKRFIDVCRFDLKIIEFESFEQLVKEKLNFIENVNKDYDKVIILEDLKDLLSKLDSNKFIKIFVDSNVCNREYEVKIL